MKTLTLITMLIATAFMTAQTVSNVPLKDIKVDYVEIYGFQKTFSSKMNVCLDFGQQTKAMGGSSQTYIRDDSGQPIEFNSIVDALNLMASFGYELVETYLERIREDLEVTHYVLRRE